MTKQWFKEDQLRRCTTPHYVWHCRQCGVEFIEMAIEKAPKHCDEFAVPVHPDRPPS